MTSWSAREKASASVASEGAVYALGVSAFGVLAAAGFLSLNLAAAASLLRARSAMMRSSSSRLPFRFMLGSLPNTPAIVMFPLAQSN